MPNSSWEMQFKESEPPKPKTLGEDLFADKVITDNSGRIREDLQPFYERLPMVLILKCLLGIMLIGGSLLIFFLIRALH